MSRILRLRPATLLSLLALVCVLVPILAGSRIDAVFTAMLHRLSGLGPFGAGLFLMLQFVVAATGILPASLLGVGAGAAYGFFLGALISVVGTLAGAVAGFHIGRRGLRNIGFLPKRLSQSLERADAYVVADGWKSVFLIRLSPVMPFAATSIALGASRIGERNYLIGTSASLPALLGYVYAGSLLAGEISLASPGLHTVLVLALAVGAIAGVIVLARFISHLSRSPDEPRGAQRP